MLIVAVAVPPMTMTVMVMIRHVQGLDILWRRKTRQQELPQDKKCASGKHNFYDYVSDSSNRSVPGSREIFRLEQEER